MASSRTTRVGSFLLCALLLLNLLQSHQTVGLGTSGGGLISPVSPPTGSPINCEAECGRRCSKSSRPNRCNKACMSCCHTCQCVPPGTAGNTKVCPCYDSLLNPKNGAHKCP